MSADDDFERALAALLDGSPLPDDVHSPLAAHLGLLRDIAAVYTGLTPGSAPGTAVSDAQPAGPGIRWGHLELRDPLGRGASATVYRSWDTNLGREVALKLFDTASVDARDALREGQHLASLRHAHLVTVYGADTFDGLPGLWMELIHGNTVDAIVAHSGPWPIDAVLIAGRDLAAALATLHDRNLIHRDVKARNVIRERGGRHVLMDLGAGFDATDPDDHRVQGTPLYMAPEVLAGAPASMRSDTYALGVLLFFAASGQYPVTASSLGELRERHRDGVRQRLRDVCPHVPPDIAQVVDACCAADAADRPSSSRAVEAACAAALARLTADAHPIPSVVERAWARARRPLQFAIAGGLAGALALLLGWDSRPVRDLLWAVGRRAPASPIYLTGQGRIEQLEGSRLTFLRAIPPAATPLAVATTDGLIATMGGTPPFEQGGLLIPVDGGPEQATDAAGGICCFNDGTTDGRFNYAVRRDDTRSPGSRALAPAAVYRFTRAWRAPEPLFELGPTPDYYGIAYLPDLDQFAISWRDRNTTRASLELWTRDGHRTAILAEMQTGLLGVGYDPADRTIWVAQDSSETQGARLLAFDPTGRLLGARHLPGTPGSGLTSLECPLPASDPPVVRAWRRLRSRLP